MWLQRGENTEQLLLIFTFGYTDHPSLSQSDPRTACSFSLTYLLPCCFHLKGNYTYFQNSYIAFLWFKRETEICDVTVYKIQSCSTYCLVRDVGGYPGECSVYMGTFSVAYTFLFESDTPWLTRGETLNCVTFSQLSLTHSCESHTLWRGTGL